MSCPRLRVTDRAAAGPGVEARDLARILGLTTTVAEWLRHPGATTTRTRRGAFCDPKLAHLSNARRRWPTVLVAADRLASAIRRGERIAVFGDYDCDGITSAAIMTEILRELGGQVIPLLASRFDGGYGVSKAACDRIVRQRRRPCSSPATAALRITCRSTRSGHAASTSIVIDHHLVPDEPLPVLAFLNPHRPECGFAYKGLASCGLALSLGAALRAALGKPLDCAHGSTSSRSGPSPTSHLSTATTARSCGRVSASSRRRPPRTAGARRVRKARGAAPALRTRRRASASRRAQRAGPARRTGSGARASARAVGRGRAPISPRASKRSPTSAASFKKRWPRKRSPRSSATATRTVPRSCSGARAGTSVSSASSRVGSRIVTGARSSSSASTAAWTRLGARPARRAPARRALEHLGVARSIRRTSGRRRARNSRIPDWSRFARRSRPRSIRRDRPRRGNAGRRHSSLHGRRAVRRRPRPRTSRAVWTG